MIRIPETARLALPPAVLTAALMATLPAAAEQVPRPGASDPRVTTVAYDPADVVRIVASPTSSTEIAFAPAEEITQVAIGDAEGWLAQPAGHLLFLKPTAPHPPTNAQVVTRRADGSVRSYQLRLVAVAGEGAGGTAGAAARPASASPASGHLASGTTSGGGEGGGGAGDAVVFAVRYRYPGDERAERSARRARAAAEARERAAEARLVLSWAEGPRNWRYLAQGAAGLEPAEVSDNGRQTALRFPGSRRIPALYVLAPDGSETLAPFTMAGDVAVVQTTARVLVLRDGRAVLRLINRGYDPAGRNPGTGTATPDVLRTVGRERP